MVKKFRAPTKAELAAALNRTVPDVIAPGLKVLFCGINPGLYSAVVGHHFARPGNRFWPALHRAGYTEEQLHPSAEQRLLDHGYGITNVVARATSGAAELSRDELIEGGAILRQKIEYFQPTILAVLGLGAYRTIFGNRKASVGQQPEIIGTTRLWALPNPSGLNAHYQIDDLARLYREVRQAAEI